MLYKKKSHSNQTKNGPELFGNNGFGIFNEIQEKLKIIQFFSRTIKPYFFYLRKRHCLRNKYITYFLTAF